MLFLKIKTKIYQQPYLSPSHTTYIFRVKPTLHTLLGSNHPLPIRWGSNPQRPPYWGSKTHHPTYETTPHHCQPNRGVIGFKPTPPTI